MLVYFWGAPRPAKEHWANVRMTPPARRIAARMPGMRQRGAWSLCAGQ